MAVDKLPEFAKNGQKNTDGLNQEDGFPVNLKPARQWFNFLFNKLNSVINQIIDEDYIRHNELIDNLTTNDPNKPLSAKQGKVLQDAKLDKTANAASATKLQTARTINGVGFDGSKDITIHMIPNVGRYTAPANGSLLHQSGLSLGEIYLNGYPFSYGNVLNIGGSGWSQIALGWGENNIAYRSARDIAKEWSEWKFIAFTDSNVESATKLATSRSLWGNLFDGTGNINGTIDFGYSDERKILLKASSQTDGGFIAVGNTGVDSGYIEVGTIDDSGTEIWVTQRAGLDGDIVRKAILLDGNGNTHFPGQIESNTIFTNSVNLKAEGAFGGNGLYGRNEDGASYDTHNIAIRSWWGIGFRDYENICRMYIDTRSGNLSTLGEVSAVNFNASRDITAAGWIYAGKFVGPLEGNATSATKLQTARTINGVVFDGTKDIVLPEKGLGVDQSYQNVSDDRFRNVVYKNTTGKPILVLISGRPSSMTTSHYCYISINNIAISSANDGNSDFYCSFIVQHNEEYCLKCNVNFKTYEWAELR